MPNDIKVRPHKTLERNGQIALQLSEGEYSGIIFSFGGVSFDENKQLDHLTIKFDYTIYEGEDETLDKAAFEKYIGDFLMELIVWGAHENNLIYKGGIDENREDNIIESDSQ
jgi:hypothetical protein